MSNLQVDITQIDAIWKGSHREQSYDLDYFVVYFLIEKVFPN